MYIFVTQELQYSTILIEKTVCTLYSSDICLQYISIHVLFECSLVKLFKIQIKKIAFTTFFYFFYLFYLFLFQFSKTRQLSRYSAMNAVMQKGRKIMWQQRTDQSYSPLNSSQKNHTPLKFQR